ncbi:MAG TPA: hemerythrin domain-containing protein [Burkholderiales bacterium]|jgi:hemerythrin-like domain-containing protein
MDEPLDTLQACHQGIEFELGVLENFAAHLAARGSDEAARSAASAVMRYFDTVAAAHHRDEDEDLFPLLREAAARDGRDEICATLYELQREHQSMDRLYAQVRAELQAIAVGESARLDAELVARFAWIHRRHMRMEGDLLLPYARQAIGPAQRAALGERMAARRQAAQA